MKDPLSDTNDAVSGAVSVTPVAGASSAAVNASPTPASPASSAAPTPSSSGKQCRVKKRAGNQTSFDAVKRAGISAHKKRRLTSSH